MLYAAYGSNLHPGRLRRRIESARLLGTVQLEGWRLSFGKRSWVDGSGKCTLVQEPIELAVHLAVYSVEPGDRRSLDEIEGLGKGYEEAWLEVPGFGKAFTYLAASSHFDETLLPFTWYRDLVVLGCEDLGFPERYIESIRIHRSVEDGNQQRRVANRGLLEVLAAESGRQSLSERS